MTKEEFLQSGLIEQHVLGLTSPEEEQVVQQFLQLHPELKSEVNGLHNAMQQYANQYTIPPPAKARQLVSSGGPAASTQNQVLSSSKFWLYGLLVAFGVLSMWLYQNNRQQQQTITQLEAEYAALSSYCDQHEQKARNVQALLDKTKLPSTEKYVLLGTDLAPEHFAIAFWNPELKEGWLDPTKLPQLPANQQYQVWADVHGEMISVGLIPKDNNSLLTIEYMPEAESINITQETLGGADHPNVALLTANGYL